MAEFLAEQVEVVSADDVQLRLQVFEPVRPRVGLTLPRRARRFVHESRSVG